MPRDPKAPVQKGTAPAPDSYFIEVVQDGPYMVHGAPPLKQVVIEQNASGNSGRYAEKRDFESKPKMAICRCGHSKNAPFCDGSHVKAGEDLTERASFEPLLSGSEEIDGPKNVLTDNEKYCAFARFCDNGHRIWNEVQMEGKDHENMTLFMGHHCPGGRLLVWDRETVTPIESKESPSMNFIEDPAEGCSGPIMVRGGIAVISGDGRGYEIRNRQALCRCGKSSNKPFCDGTHASFKYHDGID